MASPQLENGYTRIANELLEAILGFGFSKRQIHVLLHIARKTYGFNKTWDDMTIQQIATAIGVDRAHTSRALRELIDINAVLKEHGKFGNSLRINKNFDKWGRAETAPVLKEHAPRAETAHLPVLKQHPQKTTPKDTSKRQINGDAGFDAFWKSYPKKRGKGDARRAWAKIRPGIDQRQVISKAVERAQRSEDWTKEGGRFIPNPATWLNREGWEDEYEAPSPPTPAAR